MAASDSNAQAPAQAPFSLVGKSALVTGAARGIGLAISRALAASGATVLMTDIDADEAEHSAAAVGSGGRCSVSPAPSALACRLDVTSPESIHAAVEYGVAQMGRIDILVNNAGINTASDRVTVERYREEDWRRILSVDLDGVFLVSRPVVEHMKTIGGGRIVNISSVLGIVPARLQSGYIAAKAAVIGLTRSMAIELAPHGILVNSVAPGSTLTEGTRKLFYGEDGAYSDKAQSLLSHIPLGRPAQPEEIAAAVVYLAAPASSYVTGVVLPVDGGWTSGYLRDW